MREHSLIGSPPRFCPFLVVGHTKFAPDRCSGLFKRYYRRTKISSLKGISQVEKDSAHCNFAQLVSDESGATIVPTSDWTDLFAPHLKVANIKKYHHFRCDSSQPEVVFIKEHADTDENLWSPHHHGYNIFHHWFNRRVSQPKDSGTFTRVSAQFFPDSVKDTTCPLPEVQRPRSVPGTCARRPQPDIEKATKRSVVPSGKKDLYVQA